MALELSVPQAKRYMHICCNVQGVASGIKPQTPADVTAMQPRNYRSKAKVAKCAALTTSQHATFWRKWQQAMASLADGLSLQRFLAMATGRKGNLVTMACKSFSFDFLWKVGHPQIEAFNNNCNVSDLKRATPFRLSLASYDTLMVLY